MTTQNIYSMVDTWNAAGTTFKGISLDVTDTASAADSLLIDLQVGGTSQFKVSKGGRITAQTLTIGLGGQTAVATNTALGYLALNSASLTGFSNTGVGYNALLGTSSGKGNSAVGVNALIDNTTGEFNSAVGVNALFANTTGNSNCAIGREALYSNTTGLANIAIGVAAIRTATSGSNNIAIGYQAGDVITTGSTNIVIGHDMDVDSATANNQINIGDRYFHDRIRLLERGSDPAKPTEGNCIVWMSDGTGLGDDGDIIIASTAGGVTNYAILFDHSAGTLWS